MTAISSPPALESKVPTSAERLVDSVLVIGLIASITLSSIDFSLFDVETGSTANTGVVLAQRLSVYLPFAFGILFGIPILGAMRTRAMGLFVLFGLWASFAALFTDSPLEEFDRALWFLTFILLVMMATVRLGWSRVLLVLSVTSLALVSAGLVAYFGGWPAAEEVDLFEYGLFDTERVRGLATQENAFGRMAAYLVLAGAIFLVPNRPTSRTALGVASIAVGLPALLLSQSRFAILSVLFAVLFVVVRNVRAARGPAAIMVLLAGTVAALILFTGALGPLARSDDAGEAASLFGRTAVWNEAIKWTSDSPVTGIGTEAVTANYRALDDAGYFNWNPTNAHNVILQTSASHGIAASWLLIGALVLGVSAAIHSKNVGVLAVILMFSIQGVVEAILIGNPTIAPALLIAALASLTLEKEVLR